MKKPWQMPAERFLSAMNCKIAKEDLALSLPEA
jgi:hypothetical protein